MVRIALDIRYAWRSLAVRRGSSTTIALVTAVGVGLSSAVFALADPYVTRSLPYPHSDRLVAITWAFNRDTISPSDAIPTLQEWEARTELFEAVAAINETPTREHVTTPVGLIELTLFRVSPRFFEITGVPRLSTRLSRVPQSVYGTESSAQELIVLTAKGGNSAFGRDTNSLESSMFLTRPVGQSLEVVGLLPSHFVLPSTRKVARSLDGLIVFQPTALVTITADAARRIVRNNASAVIARLRPGIAPGVAQQALRRQLSSGTEFSAVVEPLTDVLTRDIKLLASGAFAAGTLILLVCAGNVANLFLSRWAYRVPELSVRTALGASNGDIARLIALDATLLAIVGICIGLVISTGALALARLSMPAELTVFGLPNWSWRTTSYGVLSGLLVMLSALGPSMMLRWRRVPVDRWQFVRLAFVAGQCALAMILAVGATLLVMSYVNLIRQDSGYDPAAFLVGLRQSPSRDPEPTLELLRRIPGVLSAAAIHGPLAEDGAAVMTVEIGGREVEADIKTVTPGFFETAGIRIITGRGFVAGDLQRPAVVVDERFAARHWPEGTALAGMVTFGRGKASVQAQIVGVVQTVFDRGLATEPTPTLYTPVLNDRVIPGWRFLLKASDPPVNYQREIRHAVAQENRGAVVAEFSTIGDRLADSIRHQTFAATVFSWFAVAAVMLSVLGIAGIVTFVIARRTREVAIRISIGARGVDVWKLFGRETVVAAALGLCAGLLVGRWMAIWLSSLLYGVSPGGVIAPIVACVLILGIVTAATIVPISRICQRNPAAVLRVE